MLIEQRKFQNQAKNCRNIIKFHNFSLSLKDLSLTFFMFLMTLSIESIILIKFPFWKWWGIYMGTLLVLYIIGEIIENIFKSTPSNYSKKKYTLNVTKAGFINAVIEWCKENMEYPKHHKYYPTVEVKYYKNKKANGDYSSRSRIIRIFVNNHKSIEDLVDTCIHEYTHYLQMPKEAHQIEYNKFNNTKGYYDNPYEIDARTKAKQYTPKCLNDLYKLGYISNYRN